MIVVQVPLRVSFFGGGTDLRSFYQHEPGCVLSSAIDKHVFAIVKERFDELICLNYSRREVVTQVDEVEHDLIREAMRLTGVCNKVEITTLADIPSEGSGLGSSSTVTVALLLALYSYRGILRTADQLAEEACQIEIELLGKPIGKQDQYIAAFGDTRCLTFLPDETVGVESIELDDDARARLSERLMLFYTNHTRSADIILQEQAANAALNREILRQMKAQVEQGKEALRRRDFDMFGSLLDEAWMLKRQLASGISNGELDAMYDTARRGGAIGGKITGAGGGGFLLVYCPPGRQDAVRQALCVFRELPFRLARDGARVVFSNGR